MSRPRFLADHDLNEQIVDGAVRREPAIEFVRARDFQLETAHDVEILEFAASENWIVVSHDVTTMTAAAERRLQSDRPMAGLIMVRQGDPVSLAIENLIMIWSSSERDEWKNQVVIQPL